MGISRRHFLEVGSLAAAACAIPLEGAGQTRPENEMARNATREGAVAPPHGAGTITNRAISESAFRSLVDSHFTMTLENGKKTSATLVAVESAAPADAKSKFKHTQSFTLRFRLNAVTTVVKQGTYTFSSGSTGRFSLFVVPFGTTGSNTTFSATISNPPA